MAASNSSSGLPDKATPRVSGSSRPGWMPSIVAAGLVMLTTLAAPWVHAPTWMVALAGAALALIFVHTATPRCEPLAPIAPPVDNRLLNDVLPVWRHHIEAARQHSEQSTAGIQAAFGAIVAALEAQTQQQQTRTQTQTGQATQGDAVHDEIERAMVNFQTQDRLSQMLCCVTDDMARLSDWLEQGGDLGASQAGEWLARLDASYTMEEQRSDPHGNTSIQQRETAVEFF